MPSFLRQDSIYGSKKLGMLTDGDAREEYILYIPIVGIITLLFHKIKITLPRYTCDSLRGQ